MDSPSPAPLPPTTLAPTLPASRPLAISWALHPEKEGTRASPSPGLGTTSVGVGSRFSALDALEAVWGRRKTSALSPRFALSPLPGVEFRTSGVEIWLRPNLTPCHPRALRAPVRSRSLHARSESVQLQGDGLTEANLRGEEGNVSGEKGETLGACPQLPFLAAHIRPSLSVL